MRARIWFLTRWVCILFMSSMRLEARIVGWLRGEPVYTLSHLQLEMTVARYVRRNCCKACATRLTGRV